MKTTRIILSLLGATVLAVAARANIVTLNTSSLAPGTYYVDFQLTDGSGSGNGNNSALIAGFNLSGGTLGSDIGPLGGVTGDLSSTVLMTDTSFFNEFFQSFTLSALSSFLSFDLHLSNNHNGAVSDGFGFAVLDENLFNLGTFSPGTDQFLSVDINGGALNYQTYAGVDGVPAPGVPEAGSTVLFVSLGLVGLAGLRRRLVGARIAA